MLTSKQILAFNKEENGHWYVECVAWEEQQTRLFRQSNTHLDKDGKIIPYETTQDMSNPLDDHTRHPLWHDPHEDLRIPRRLAILFEKLAADKRQLTLEVCVYGWVSNLFTHSQRVGINSEGATYKVRFNEGPSIEFTLPPMALYFLGTYPEHLHTRVL